MLTRPQDDIEGVDLAPLLALVCIILHAFHGCLLSWRDVMLDRVFEIAYLQQVIIGVVATLGVVMALLISVLQRRRELGLLRAVGATQPQVLKTVLAEAMLMGVLGTVLGVLIGLPMESVGIILPRIAEIPQIL